MARRARAKKADTDAVNALIAQRCAAVETIAGAAIATERIPMESSAGAIARREIIEPEIIQQEVIRPEVIRSEVPAAPSQPRDLEYLVTIARRHAAIVLAGPPDTHASRLHACRVVWLHYAAAFGANMAAQARFADDLQHVTQSLMEEQLKTGIAPPPPAGCPRQAEAPILTIEELRPLLHQIIGH